MRMAGRAGIGDGDRAYRVYVAGELGAFEPLNDDRRDEERSIGGGGNIPNAGVLGTECVGVRSALACDPGGPVSSF
jgi:hypothetical protein